MPAKLTAEDYHRVAKEKGCEWIGPLPETIKDNTSWRCKCGHVWQTAYRNLSKPHHRGACRKCSYEYRSEIQRLMPDAYHKIAQEKGIEWIGPEVPSANTVTGWRCSCGEIRETSYASIYMNSGSCVKCMGKALSEHFRYGPDEYNKLAAERSVEWIGPEVKNRNRKTNWRCHCGREWAATYSSIYASGGNCPACGGAEQKSPDDYRALATQKNLTWLGPEVPNVKTKTRWQCRCGRIWHSTYMSIDRNKGNCWECARVILSEAQRLKPLEYKRLAKRRGFKWLGPEVPNSVTKTRWSCADGHEWEAVYSSISMGTGCPHCAGVSPKTPDDYHERAKNKGLVWLGPFPEGAHVKTRWRCSEGHIWLAPYSGLRGCRVCAGQEPRTEDDYYKLASRRGFEWIGPLPPNVSTKTTWRCHKGHEWEARYYSVDGQGTGCPKCADFVNGNVVSQPQRNLFAMLSHLPKAELNTPYGRLNLDITLEVEGINICIEYDCWYWHKDKLEYDARRDLRLIKDGWRLLRVKSGAKLPTQAQLDAALAELVGGASYAEIILDDWGGVDIPPAKA